MTGSFLRIQDVFGLRRTKLIGVKEFKAAAERSNMQVEILKSVIH